MAFITQLLPLALLAQLTQVPPEPQAVGALPVTHIAFAQQVLPPQVPLVLAPQVAVHVVPLQVGVPLPQAVHARPFAPQAPLLVPATQVVPPQQPPLQAVCWLSPQVVSQVFVIVLQALPEGQSVAVVQPHKPDRQAEPALPGAVQSAHTTPLAPQAVWAVPITQVFAPTEQQPPLQGVFASQAVPHRCVVVLQALPAGQSAAVLQPHFCEFTRQAWPFALTEQSTHVVPGAPHALTLLPGRQFCVFEQHPPLHGEFTEQVEVQSMLVQDCDCGQSMTVPQPQKPPPMVPRQMLPLVPFWRPAGQLAQVPPLLPQAVAPVPITHVPPIAAVQQPPLHGLFTSQAVPQTWLVRLHALPGWQSAEVRQAHFAATQALPAGGLKLTVQLAHTPPAVPHAVAPVPGAHTPLPTSQQAALQTVIASHFAPHTPPEHAWPTGQSVAEEQLQSPDTQSGPRGLVAQLVQAAPESPQALSATAVQVFVAPQQKPCPHTPAPPF